MATGSIDPKRRLVKGDDDPSRTETSEDGHLSQVLDQPQPQPQLQVDQDGQLEEDTSTHSGDPALVEALCAEYGVKGLVSLWAGVFPDYWGHHRGEAGFVDGRSLYHYVHGFPVTLGLQWGHCTESQQKQDVFHSSFDQQFRLFYRNHRLDVQLAGQFPYENECAAHMWAVYQAQAAEEEEEEDKEEEEWAGGFKQPKPASTPSSHSSGSGSSSSSCSAVPPLPPPPASPALFTIDTLAVHLDHHEFLPWVREGRLNRGARFNGLIAVYDCEYKPQMHQRSLSELRERRLVIPSHPPPSSAVAAGAAATDKPPKQSDQNPLPNVVDDENPKKKAKKGIHVPLRPECNRRVHWVVPV